MGTGSGQQETRSREGMVVVVVAAAAWGIVSANFSEALLRLMTSEISYE